MKTGRKGDGEGGGGCGFHWKQGLVSWYMYVPVRWYALRWKPDRWYVLRRDFLDGMCNGLVRGALREEGCREQWSRGFDDE